MEADKNGLTIFLVSVKVNATIANRNTSMMYLIKSLLEIFILFLKSIITDIMDAKIRVNQSFKQSATNTPVFRAFYL